MKHLKIGMVMGFLLLCPRTYADDENVPSKLLSSTSKTISGQVITVPKNPKVQAMILTIPPGAKLPVHKHPYIRYGYVLKGELDVTIVNKKKVDHFNTGDFFAEVIDSWHFGTNNGKETTELLVIDQMPQSVDNNTVKQDRSN
jgi:quercetin dioxygenase-like cupin family protein